MLIDYKKELLIDHRSNISVVNQLYCQLENLISSSKIINRQPLIQPEELSKLIGVQRSDVQFVYQKLNKNNFIYFDHNQQAIVSKYNRILDFFHRLIKIEDGIKALNKKPSTDLMGLQIVEANALDMYHSSHLNNQQFLKQSRLFKADGEPYIYLEEFYPIERFPKLSLYKDWDSHTLAEHILISEYDLLFKKNERLIKIHSVNQKLAQILKVKKGNSAFRVDMIYYDHKNTPFAYATAYSLPYFYFDYNIKIK